MPEGFLRHSNRYLQKSRNNFPDTIIDPARHGVILKHLYNTTPVYNLDLGASYSYVEGKADTGRIDDKYDAYLNGRRIGAPKIGASVHYRPISGFEVGLQYTGIQERDRFVKLPSGLYKGNEGIVKAYNLVNFNASYRLTKNALVTLGVENVFNEDYFPARSQWFMIPGFYSKGKGRVFNIGIAVNY